MDSYAGLIGGYSLLKKQRILDYSNHFLDPNSVKPTSYPMGIFPFRVLGIFAIYQSGTVSSSHQAKDFNQILAPAINM